MTLGFTTCRRPACFSAMLKSLTENCTDLHLVQQVVLIDDSSEETDVRQMSSEVWHAFPYKSITVIARQGQHKGLPRSWQLMYKHSEHPFLFYVQDDWIFPTKGPFLSQAFEILAEFPGIHQVGFMLGDDYYSYARGQVKPEYVRKTSSGLEFYEWYWNGSRVNQHTWESWPHYTQQPSLMRLTEITETIGLPGIEPDSEHRFALRFADAGLKTAFLLPTWARHMKVKSAFDLNGTHR